MWGLFGIDVGQIGLAHLDNVFNLWVTGGGGYIQYIVYTYMHKIDLKKKAFINRYFTCYFI